MLDEDTIRLDVDFADNEGADESGESAEEGELNSPFSGEVSVKQVDRTLREFKQLYDEGDLILDPEWQRNYVWSNKQASGLIESLLLDIPVPMVYLATTPESKFEVVDGLQRLNSVFRFFDNKFALASLGILSKIKGKRFRDLESTEQKRLKIATLRCFELPSSTHADIRFVVFERLNTGGTNLNETEIRNCLYRGKLNDLIKELAEIPDFVQCVNESTFSKRMKDRSFVLRFLAFYEKTYLKCSSGMKKFLNDFFAYYRNPPEEKLQEYRNVFKYCAWASFTVFGDDGFRLKKEDPGTSKLSGEWAPTTNIAIFQCIATSFANYNRCFSRQLKKELFLQSQTCSICENEIKLMDDAVLDHIEHYWRGGKTVPENARLVHRYCNLERGGN